MSVRIALRPARCISSSKACASTAMCSGDDAVSVEHRRNLPGRAQRMRAGRAELLRVLDGEIELFSGHGFLYKRTR